jgi:hypothetical protein
MRGMTDSANTHQKRFPHFCHGDCCTTYADLFEAAEAAQTLADELGEPHYVRKERATGLLVVQPAEPVDGNAFLTIWGPAEPSDPHGHLATARYLGADAALAAAETATFGMTAYQARALLSPAADDDESPYVEPNLSGEWADDLTPAILYREVTGVTTALATPDEVDAVAEAWEEGRDAVWGDALQAHALRLLGDIQTALELERDLENRVDALRIRSEHAAR